MKIGNSVTEIGYRAFYKCSALTIVVIPNSVKQIGTQAFHSCSNLKRIDFSAHTSVPTLSNIDAFSGTASDLQIKVPATLETEWIGASNWSDLASKIVTEFTNTL